MKQSAVRPAGRQWRGYRKIRVNRSIAGDTVLFILIGILAVSMVIPLVFSIINAFKPLNEIFLFPPRLYVKNPTLDNFSQLFIILQNSWVPFSRYLLNSLFLTAAGTILNIIFASMCAYPLAKMNLPFSGGIFRLIILTLMFSTAVTTIPNYLLMSKLRLIDTYWSLLLPAIASSVGLFLMKQYMEANVPNTLLEAAKIDGANDLYIFFRIVMPIVKPAWFTMIIFNVQALWGQTGDLFIYQEQLKTLPYALSQVLSGGIVRTGPAAAATLIMMLVPIVTFVLTQTSIIETMTASGI